MRISLHHSRFLLLTLLTAALLLVGPAAAHAEEVFGFETGGFRQTFGDQFEAGAGGSADTEAGSHPNSMTTTFAFNHTVVEEKEEPVGEEPIPTAVNEKSSPKSVTVNLPQGVVVNPDATPTRCTEAELEGGSCPVASAVGVVQASTTEIPYRVLGPLYDMVAPYGSPGVFGANLARIGFVVHIDGSVRSDGDYGLSANVDEITNEFKPYALSATFWGSPSDPSHNSERGNCGEQPRVVKSGKGGESCPLEHNYERSKTALLTMPGSCPGQPLTTSTTAESWGSQELPVPAVSSSPALTGCDALAFDPTIEATPETGAADSPTGLKFDLHVPQEDNFEGEGDLPAHATANLKNAVVTLPAGLSVNPSSAEGLEACSPAQIGLLTPSNERQTITIERPVAGSFTLSYEGHTTPSLPATASAAEVQAALQALPGIGAGNVEVDPPHFTSISGGWEVLFTGALEHREVSLLSGQVTDNASQLVNEQGTGGTFTLSFEGNSTPSLPWYATAEVVQKELEKLPGLAGNVAVTGGRASDIYTGARNGYTVAFTGTLAGHEVQTLGATSLLTGPGAGVKVTSQASGLKPLQVAMTEEGGAVRFAEQVPNPANEGKLEDTACPTGRSSGRWKSRRRCLKSRCRARSTSPRRAKTRSTVCSRCTSSSKTSNAGSSSSSRGMSNRTKRPASSRPRSRKTPSCRSKTSSSTCSAARARR